MPGLRDTASGGQQISARVLRPSDKENVAATVLSTGRTPDRRGSKSASGGVGFKVFQEENGALRPSATKRERTTLSQLTPALSHAEAEAARCRGELEQAHTSLKARNERVQELKAITASSNERYTALLKSHEEANKELALLRTQLARGGSDDGSDVERLKSTAENLEISNELLREERSSLEGRLARREASLSKAKNDVTAAAQREAGLLEELEHLRTELETEARDASERSKARSQAVFGSDEQQAQWMLEKAALNAQVSELEAQLASSGRRCAGVAAERAVLAEESCRREKEHGLTVAALESDLQCLHRRTSADLKDWQRRHREALAVKKAVEGQLQVHIGAGELIKRVGEKQAALESSLQEALELISADEGRKRDTGAGELARASPQRVVEGVIENLLGRVSEAAREKGQETSEEGRRERVAEEEFRTESGALLVETIEKLTAEMEKLREFGVAEAEVFLEQAQLLETELEGVRERQEKTVLDLQAAREEREREVKRLTREVDEGGNERKELEVRLESAKMEVAATVQLSELALAAKGAAGTQRLEELEAERGDRDQKLETERRAYAERMGELEVKRDTLENENQALHEKLRELREQASELKAVIDAREAVTPQSRSPSVSDEESAAARAKLQDMQERFASVVAENQELERRVTTVSPGKTERQAKILALEREVDKLRDTAVAGRERAERVDNDDVLMRRYMVYYKSRCENKMVEMKKRLAKATALPDAEDL